MRIIFIEDDKGIAQFVTNGLKESGFSVDHFENGIDGLDHALAGDYNLVIVDIMLPKMDGFKVIEYLRAQNTMTPILILSAKGRVSDRVKGLNLGADDYLVKPFAFSELLARVNALLRRSHTITEQDALVEGELVLDLVRRKVTRKDKVIDLQPLELALLEYLLRFKGRVVSKTMIMEHVWDYNFDPQTNVVEARICRLRDKIDRGFDTKMIHTIRGVGYVLEEK